MNSEQMAAAESLPESQPMATTGNPSFTLAEKKLAGSAQCLNCGTELKGPFCYYCGQPDRNLMRFFPALVRDLLEDFLDLDSRFMRTLKPLLFKPGKLTRDYMTGRRSRYTPPMRLYLFSSILFFILASFLSNQAIIITPDAQTGSFIDPDDVQQIVESNPGLQAEDLNRKIQLAIEQEEQRRETDPDNGESTPRIQFNSEPWDRETNPLIIPMLPKSINGWLNDEIEKSPEKQDRIEENPDLIVDKVFDLAPGTMFILLPIAALILKLWYLFAKRYYVEHLIHSLHNHAFIFTSLILMLLLNEVGDLLGSRGYKDLRDYSEWLIAAIGIWIPIYLFISLRVVYQQNWFMTIAKCGLIGISYLTLLIVITTAVALTSFVLL